MSGAAGSGSVGAATVGAGPVARWVILGLAGVAFAVPIVAMLEFTLRDGDGHSLVHWAQLVESALGDERAYRPLTEGITTSLVLVLATVLIVDVLLLPTMLVVQLAAPRLERALEIICILPISIPAIVLVVGLAPVYSVVARIAGSGAWTLAFAYGITTLPFAYRAIAAQLRLVDVRTLSEASRSLGASWLTTFWRVLLPSIRRGVLTASVLATAIVLGEYTIAALLNRTVLQTALVQIQQTDAFASVIVSLLALALAFALLLAISGLDRPRRGTRRQA